ncbi:C40 family peptidase [Corynebacterium sp. HMSC05H05]|uniref:C40 family peptidase n=1 Tax=Corynebacterium sp. HMSC05H05 TaxID=1581119 RepID=UPI000AFAD0BF|nr:NlpC/P60 family protein [Corynebacterium sp. HMSC05H05]
MSSVTTDFGNAIDLLDRIAGSSDVAGSDLLNVSLDVHATANLLVKLLPFDLPTLPGFVMPDFKDFDPLAAVANTSGASRVGAAADLADYRATISDGVMRGGMLIGTAAFELGTIAGELIRNAVAAPAIAASPAGLLGAAAYVVGLIGDAIKDATRVLKTLEKDLRAVADTLTSATSAAMNRVIPGAGPAAEKAHGELQRLASLVAPSAKEAPEPTPPVVKPASTVAPPPPPEHKQASAPPPEPVPSQETGSAVGAAAVDAAKSQLGTPYVWGGAAPGGFDCSGLTSWAYSQAGLEIPRVAADQTVGRQVSYQELQPGDLVLWSGHAAMYAGDGMMIEAGNPVQMNPVRTENVGMTFRGFWRPTG